MHPLSQEDILNQYSALAYSIAKNYRNKGLDWDDLKQECLLGLLKAWQHFKPDLETQFSTYASFWIKKQVIEALKQEGSTKTEVFEEALHAVAKVGFGIRPYENDMVSAQETLDLRLPPQLPEQERKIIAMSFAQQKSLKEIAECLKISVERTSQLKKKALRRLRASGWEIPA